MALISGRAITDLDRLFAPLCLPAAGQHGAEYRSADWRLHEEHTHREVIKAALARLHEFAAAHPGLLLEDKGLCLALHYRQAPDLETAAIRWVTQLIDEFNRTVELQHGKMVLEIKPIGITKGHAIAKLMTSLPFLGRTPVFIGDDLTDEDGFQVVNAAAGCSIKVGPGATCARYRLSDSEAVRRWLNDYLAWIHQEGDGGAGQP